MAKLATMRLPNVWMQDDHGAMTVVTASKKTAAPKKRKGLDHGHVLTEFEQTHPEHGRAEYSDENGGSQLECLPCGARWSVTASPRGFVFDRVSEGDGFCEERAGSEDERLRLEEDGRSDVRQ
jgi:hypothetical protein